MNTRHFLATSYALVIIACQVAAAGVPVLAAPRFDKLRETALTTTAPQGWLKEFLVRQNSGLTGHHEVLSYPFNTCLWAGMIPRQSTHGADWWRYEQTAYLSDGIIRLGYLLGDDTLVKAGSAGVAYLLAHPQKNGRLGYDFFTSQWPMAVYFRVMQAEYLATRSPQLLEALRNHYLSYSVTDLIKGHRHIVNLEGMLWTYGQTGDAKLLELAEAAYRAGGDEMPLARCASPDRIAIHGVTYMEEAKLPAILYTYTGKQEYLDASVNAMRKLDRDHMLPDGVPSSNEYLVGKNPLYSHETCDISDYTWSVGYLLMATGDATWADHIEKAVFNAGLGCVSKDFKNLQYFSSVNQVIATGDSNHNKGSVKSAYGSTWMAYWPCHETECCAGNVHRFMPNYAARMWMRDSQGGLVAALYGPSVKTLPLDGGKNTLTVTEETGYPFSEVITFRFATPEPVRLPFSFRIPAWCRKPAVTINGEAYADELRPGTFVTLTREIRQGDVVKVQLPMPVVLTNWEQYGVMVERGPLLFAYAVPETVTVDTKTYANLRGKKSPNPDFPALDIRPAGAWNYALATSPETMAQQATVVETGATGYPFDSGSVPVAIKLPARKVMDWKLTQDRFTPPLPAAGLFTCAAETETITLVPYGSTRLRVSVFPSTAAAGTVSGNPLAARTGVEIVNNARFTVVSPTLVRMEQAAGGAFVDAPSWFAANRQARCQTYTAKQAAGEFVLDTGKLKLTYVPDGKPFSKANLKIELADGTIWVPGTPNPGNLGGTIRTLDGWAKPGSLGEGVLSKDGWYLLDDSNSYLLLNDWPAARLAGHGSDWYFFGYGGDFRQGLRDLTLAGGAIPLPRKSLLGCWYSRYWNYSADDYKKLVEEYHQHDFPLDVMVMDMDWHLYNTNYPNDPRFAGVNTWTGYTFDPKLIPAPQELAQWFHQQGLAVTLNDHPAAGIQRHEECYADFMKAMGADPASGNAIPFDAGDKRYMDPFWKYSHQPKAAMGFDFWWLDWQQYVECRSLPGLTNLAALNRYYFGATAQDGKRGTSFSRWAGWGDHRYPIHFSGDTHINWQMLGFEVPMTATAGNVGCFFWSHDIGGHMGGLGRADELYARWVQFGAMSPALRSHSTRNAQLDRRPWTYAPWACEAMRRAFHLRAELMPYIYTSAWQGHAESLPLCRPMYLAGGPANEAQQYLFGDHLLVAPVTMPGHGPGKLGWQELWLPAGDEWVNWFTGERFEGGRRILVACDLDSFPLFVRAGAAIPMQPYSERPTTAKLKTLTLRVFPASGDKTVKSRLYEDDGLTDGYLKGECAVTDIETVCRNGRATVNVAPTQGRFPGQVAWTVERQIQAVNPDASRLAVEKRLAALLGRPVTLAKLTDALHYAEGELTTPVLAALGIGLVEHNNHPYLWNGLCEVRFYDTYGLVGNPPAPSGTAVTLAPKTATTEELVSVPGQPATVELPVEIAGKSFALKCAIGLHRPPAAAAGRRPKVTASSVENGYSAAGAVDGIADGYPNNQACEWASGGEKAGAWLKLEWPAAKTVSGLLVYDRPNSEDQVLAATVTFDDGSTVAVGELPNDGKSPVKLTFPPRQVKSLIFRIDKVSGSTKNAGIAEIAAW